MQKKYYCTLQNGKGLLEIQIFFFLLFGLPFKSILDNIYFISIEFQKKTNPFFKAVVQFELLIVVNELY